LGVAYIIAKKATETYVRTETTLEVRFQFTAEVAGSLNLLQFQYPRAGL